MLEHFERNKNFSSDKDLRAKLAKHGVTPSGEFLVGPVEKGKSRTAGQQRIIKLFESGPWNAEYPEANEHPSPALLGNGAKVYAEALLEAEVKRMNIVVAQLEAEYNRKCKDDKCD